MEENTVNIETTPETVEAIDPMAELDMIRTREKNLLASIRVKQQDFIGALEDTCRILGERIKPERLVGVLPIKHVRGPRTPKPAAVPGAPAKEPAKKNAAKK